MRKGFIKTVVMTASLGLALFFSGQARAVDLVFTSCAPDTDTGDLILGTVHTSSGAVLPAEVEEGAGCLDAIKALKAANCTRSELVSTIASEAGLIEARKHGNELKRKPTAQGGVVFGPFVGGITIAAICPESP